ncbi:hypothetical protein BDD12DRAFT_803420 [Trichophaea hybrida]|nr:hypothetical protein BDD12DRAFT_803420 [Trichophaea hybrida]
MQDQNKDDIRRFAADFLHSDHRMSGKVLCDAINYITENAQGVFVWVSLIRTELLTHVERGRPHVEILQCLKALPQDLKDTYTIMFHRLENSSPPVIQDIKRLFRFVILALRPLTVVELRDALAMSDDYNPFQEELQEARSAVRRRIECCGGNFLEIKEDQTVQFMHQTARDFLIQTIPNVSILRFELNYQAYRAITTTWIRYLMLCFTSTNMRNRFSKIESWSSSDFRSYDLCGRNEEVSQLVTTLIRLLADNPASYFLGSFIDFRFRNINGQEIPVNERQVTSEDIKYGTLNAAAEPKLPQVVQTLLLTYAMIPVVRRWTSPDWTDPGLSPTPDWTSPAKSHVMVQSRPVETGLIPV